MAIAIRAENLSKAYQLGEFTTGTLSQDIERMWYRVRGKEDPFLKVGETNDRSVRGTSNMVWSLKDINFDIQQGDAVGIIGRNGAGKSTLLKILSRVTSPTTGSLKVKGRIASLLEVGTGFHPELTGRENIFLNGAILGMRKAEIKRKFDEIVDFSGVERYIDTPVKRYSSGMYVRLAFAVAAHLESEILIVDEVLAVGDAEFQKKCLGKMGEVSVEKGRTVLFVSHNLSAIETICRQGIYLKTGLIQYIGKANDTVVQYLSNETKNASVFESVSIEGAPGNERLKLIRSFVKNAEDYNSVADVSSPVDIAFELVNTSSDELISVGFDMLNLRGDVIFGSGGFFTLPLNTSTTAICKIPAHFLNDGSYTITFYAHDKNMAHLVYIKRHNRLRGKRYRKRAWVPGKNKWRGKAKTAMGGEKPGMKKLLITQSNYIPWKGYFDSINLVDELVLYDDMQYTKRDWRNRNKIKTANGIQWLSIPVEVKGKYFQKINETKISDKDWAKDHWASIKHNYSKAPYFKDYKDFFEDLYLNCQEELLSNINFRFLKGLMDLLQITTPIRWSSEFELRGDKSEKLLGICEDEAATDYFSGPAAKDYLDNALFNSKNIHVHWFDYTGYKEYEQLYPPFEHGVSIIDLILNTGPHIKSYMKSFA